MDPHFPFLEVVGGVGLGAGGEFEGLAGVLGRTEVAIVDEGRGFVVDELEGAAELAGLFVDV